MKKKLYILLLLFFAAAGLGSLFLSCDSDDDSGCVGVDCLPTATTTGAGTFGCHVNGVPYVDNSGNFNCFYQLVDGEYFFSISAQIDYPIKEIGIGSRYISIQELETYPLIEIGQNKFSADIFIDSDNNFETNSNTPGNITISMLNL
jgi:hypothetical protein